MTSIIGFIGSKGAGKTTAFNYLDKIFSNMNEVMVAKTLKKVCAAVLSIPESDLSDQSKKEVPFPYPYRLTLADLEYIYYVFQLSNDTDELEKHEGASLTSPRQAAQYIGTQIIRKVDSGAHLRAASGMIQKDKINVVTDIRFLNELEFFKKLDPNFTLLYINREVAEEIAVKDGHESEKGLYGMIDQAHVVLENNGSLHEFREKIRFMIPTIQLRGGWYK